MRIPTTAHTERPWRIHEIAPDFKVLDVWAFRAPGAGPDDLATMLDAIRTASAREREPFLVRVLFAVRWKLGEIFGWDDPEKAERVTSLADRLPSDLHQSITGMPVPGVPFTHLYELPDEHAMEVANATVHAVAHYSWVRTGPDEYEMRMAVLVKPNGLPGWAYMAAIAPFRYLIVYPAMTRQFERAWLNRAQLSEPSPRAGG